MTTPKHIWQTWKSKDPKNIPVKLYEYTKKWKTLHPDYEYTLLDDDDLRQIVSEVAPEHLEKYDSFTRMIERVDFARYALLYRSGGIYADIDTNPLKSIDVWVSKNKIVLGCEPKEHAKEIYNRDRVICNALMISPPRQQVWLELMNYIAKNYESRYRPVDNTGPMAMTRFLEANSKFNDNIIITDPCIFYPLLSNGEVSKDCDLEKSYVAHIWQNTWVVPFYKDPMWLNKRGLCVAVGFLFVACGFGYLIWRSKCYQAILIGLIFIIVGVIYIFKNKSQWVL